MGNDAYQLQGQNGGITINGTDSFDSAVNNGGKPARAIQIIADAVFTSITSNVVDAETFWVGVTHPADRILYGQTDELTLASGTVTLYF